MMNNLLSGDAFKVEALTTREHSRKHLMNIGCCHDKNSVWGWFFERFEQGVECFVGKHMSFVEDIDLVFARCGGHHDLFAQIADTINTTIRGGIDLDHVK